MSLQRGKRRTIDRKQGVIVKQFDSHRCPLCASVQTRRIRSAPDFFRRCAACGIVFNTAYSALSYGDSYFLGEYEKQYGKTYSDDYGSIYALSLRRLDTIRSLMPQGAEFSSVRALDIGCAMGFFLKAALDRGAAHAEGVEISSYASQQCRERFGISVFNGPFDRFQSSEKFDLITAWYFIEHCENPGMAFEKLNGLLKKGGILAFSAPSVFGPQFLFHRTQWASAHPKDHRIDFSPRSAKRALRRIGFRKIITRPGGIHPERMMDPGSPFYGLFRRGYRAFSNLFSFSDTIEVYAVK